MGFFKWVSSNFRLRERMAAAGRTDFGLPATLLTGARGAKSQTLGREGSQSPRRAMDPHMSAMRQA
jgi:hypothetical protein